MNKLSKEFYKKIVLLEIHGVNNWYKTIYASSGRPNPSVGA